MTVLAGARVVTPAGILEPGWVEIRDGRFVAIGSDRPPDDAHDLGGAWLLPGFVDLHMHGGGGHDVTRSSEDMRAAVQFHREHGTTNTLVSLMAAPVDAMCEQASWTADLTKAGDILGAHLEGPFLASARCGAQNHAHLLEPDLLVLAKLLEAGQGAIRTVTLAPELPRAAELIAEVIRAGAIAAVGHTDATYEQAAEAFAAGARLATHLFNAMGPIDQREPGPSIAALNADVAVEIISDGVHVHDGLVRLAARLAPGRLVLVTDATSAAGVGDGNYTLGDQQVVVRDGQPRLSSGRLAGSTLTMDAAVRRAVFDVGLPVRAAAEAAATTPARVLGVDDRCGSIAVGLDADLVVLDEQFILQRVMARGEWRS